MSNHTYASYVQLPQTVDSGGKTYHLMRFTDSGIVGTKYPNTMYGLVYAEKEDEFWENPLLSVTGENFNHVIEDMQQQINLLEKKGVMACSA